MGIIRKIGGILLIILSTGLLVTSCRSSSEEIGSQETIYLKMHPGDLPDDSKLSDVVERVRLIPLETKPECYLDGVGSLFFGENYIVVFSPGTETQLYLFTAGGQFIRTIGKTGKGPSEYAFIQNFTVIENQQLIYVADGMSGGQKIYRFDGEFVRSVPPPPGASVSKRINTGQTAYHMRKDCEIQIVTEATGESITLQPVSLQNKSHFAEMTGSPVAGVFLSLSGKDTIWRFGHDTLTPAIVFDFGSGTIKPEEYMKALSPGGLQNDKILIQGFPFQAGGYFHLLLHHQDNNGTYQTYTVLINEKTKQNWHLPSRSESDDILFSDAVSMIGSSNSGEIISSTQAIELLEALPKIQANNAFDYDPELIGQIESLKEDDNPVLVLYKLK